MILTLTTVCPEGDEVEDVQFEASSFSPNGVVMVNDHEIKITADMDYMVVGVKIKDEAGLKTLFEMPLSTPKSLVARDTLTFPKGEIRVNTV